jgi:hypothetical protein
MMNPGGGEDEVCNVCICCLSCEGTGGNVCEVYVCWVNYKENGGGENNVYMCWVSCEELWQLDVLSMDDL